MKLKAKLDKRLDLSYEERRKARSLKCSVCNLTTNAQDMQYFKKKFCYGKPDTQADADASTAQIEKRIRELTKQSRSPQEPPANLRTAEPKKRGRPKKAETQAEDPANKITKAKTTPNFSRPAQPTQTPTVQHAVLPQAQAKKRHGQAMVNGSQWRLRSSLPLQFLLFLFRRQAPRSSSRRREIFRRNRLAEKTAMSCRRRDDGRRRHKSMPMHMPLRPHRQ